MTRRPLYITVTVGVIACSVCCVYIIIYSNIVNAYIYYDF